MSEPNQKNFYPHPLRMTDEEFFKGLKKEMTEPNILRCPNCGVGQGEIGSRITYRRKRGAIHFEPQGEFQLDCYNCGEISFFKRSPLGELLKINKTGGIT